MSKNRLNSPHKSYRHLLLAWGELTTPLLRAIGICWLILLLLLLLKPTPLYAQAEAVPTLSRQPVSMRFFNTDVRKALGILAMVGKANVVIADGVSGTLTLELKDVPWEDALQTILDARGLEKKRNGSVWWIGSRTEMAEKEKQLAQAAYAQEQGIPLVTRNFRLHYARATDLERQMAGNAQTAAPLISAASPALGTGLAPVSTSYARLLSPRGSVMAEPRTNQLVVTDTPERMQHIARVIKMLDVAVRQVHIEAHIVEASDTWGRNLGVRIGGYYSRNTAMQQQAIAGSLDQANAITGAASQASSLSPVLNLPAANLQGYTPASLAFSIFTPAMHQLLNVELNALEGSGKGRIVSRPRVVTSDQHKAVIEQGTEIPYPQLSKDGLSGVQFRKANLRLEVTPRITPSGAIVLDLDINKDSPGRNTQAGLAIDTKHVQTQVVVENGGTVAIGGIFEKGEQKERSQVPLLGDIPLLGWLFSNNRTTKNKTEMLVFVTPRVVPLLTNDPPPQASSVE